MEKKRKRKGEEDGSDSEEEEEEEEVEVQEPAAKRGRLSREASSAGGDSEAMDEDVPVDDALVSSFATKLNDLFMSSSQLPMSEVVEAMTQAKVCGAAQAHKCVEVMTEQNKVMLSGDVLYRI